MEKKEYFVHMYRCMCTRVVKWDAGMGVRWRRCFGNCTRIARCRVGHLRLRLQNKKSDRIFLRFSPQAINSCCTGGFVISPVCTDIPYYVVITCTNKLKNCNKDKALARPGLCLCLLGNRSGERMYVCNYIEIVLCTHEGEDSSLPRQVSSRRGKKGWSATVTGWFVEGGTGLLSS